MAKTQWMMHTKRADFTEIGQRFSISPITARIIRNRDVVGDKAIEQYLCGTVRDLYDPDLLPDMDRAVDILKEKIANRAKIRILMGSAPPIFFYALWRKPERAGIMKFLIG